MTEWRKIGGFPGYEVSDEGQVRSWHRTGTGVAMASEPRIIGGWIGGHGYPQVRLVGDGSTWNRPIHRLVLVAFVGPCPDGMEGCHCDGNKANNSARNLRWDTREANMADRIAHGTSNRGERCGLAKLTWPKVREIRASGERQQALADRYGVSQVAVSKVLLRKTWRHDPQDAGGADCS